MLHYRMLPILPQIGKYHFYFVEKLSVHGPFCPLFHACAGWRRLQQTADPKQFEITDDWRLIFHLNWLTSILHCSFLWDWNTPVNISNEYLSTLRQRAQIAIKRSAKIYLSLGRKKDGRRAVRLAARCCGATGEDGPTPALWGGDPPWPPRGRPAQIQRLRGKVTAKRQEEADKSENDREGGSFNRIHKRRNKQGDPRAEFPELERDRIRACDRLAKSCDSTQNECSHRCVWACDTVKNEWMDVFVYPSFTSDNTWMNYSLCK